MNSSWKASIRCGAHNNPSDPRRRRPARRPAAGRAARPEAGGVCGYASSAGSSQVPKSKAFTLSLTLVMWNVTLTLSTVPEPWLTTWSLAVSVNTSVSCCALRRGPTDVSRNGSHPAQIREEDSLTVVGQTGEPGTPRHAPPQNQAQLHSRANPAGGSRLKDDALPGRI
jgi:hypothetical protein